MYNQDDNCLFGRNNKEVNTVSGIATDFSGTKAERVAKLHNMCSRQKKH